MNALLVGQRMAQDTLELLTDRGQALVPLADAAQSEATYDYLTGLSRTKFGGASMLTKQLYDMAHHETEDPQERDWVGEVGALSVILSDVVDDEVDRQEMPLEEKFRYLDQGVDSLLNGTRPDPADFASGSNPIAVAASFDLAQDIFARISPLEGQVTLKPVLDGLMHAIKEQMAAREVSRQLEILTQVGAGCSGLMMACVEMVIPEGQEEVKAASDGIGAYTVCLDNAFEMAQDVAEQSTTFATVFLDRFGDTPYNRRAAHEQLLRKGRLAVEAGRQGLSPEQQIIYRSMQRMADIKYRGLQRFSNLLSPMTQKPKVDYANA